MDHRAILTDAAHRPLEGARQVLDGLGTEALHARPGGRGNSIAWLLWHAARQADVQLAELTGGPEVWEAGGWAARTGVGRGPGDMGFGDDDAAVEGLRVEDPQALVAYFGAVVEALATRVTGWSEADLDDIVDTRWTPPVTRGVRLVSIVDDAAAHVAQAAYARGLVEGWSIGY